MEKCNGCEKESEKLIYILGIGICKKCNKEYEEARKMIDLLRK